MAEFQQVTAPPSNRRQHTSPAVVLFMALGPLIPITAWIFFKYYYSVHLRQVIDLLKKLRRCSSSANLNLSLLFQPYGCPCCLYYSSKQLLPAGSSLTKGQINWPFLKTTSFWTCFRLLQAGNPVIHRRETGKLWSNSSTLPGAAPQAAL